MQSLIASIRIVVATMLICVVGYVGRDLGRRAGLDARHGAGIADHGAQTARSSAAA